MFGPPEGSLEAAARTALLHGTPRADTGSLPPTAAVPPSAILAPPSRRGFPARPYGLRGHRGARAKAGFSLLELIAAVAILVLLAGAVLPAVAGRAAQARDARRLHDLLVVRDAIEQYRLDKGAYPPNHPTAGAGGWDSSADGDFLPELVAEGYLAAPVLDPTNDSRFQYRYHRYRAGQYGCVGPGPFYVLGIRRFESTAFQGADSGQFTCSGRDWSREFAYVTGGGASAN